MNIKLLSLLSLLFLTSCINITGNSGEKGNGKIISKEVSISDYSKIEGESTVNIMYEQNDTKTPYLRYEIDENLSQYVSIKSERQTLTIKSTKSLNTDNFKVYTNSKQLNYINVSGASSLDVNSELNGSKLELFLSGASSIIANYKIRVNEISAKASGASNLKAYQVETNILSISSSGSSDIKFEGSTDTLAIDASGASKITMNKLQCKTAEIKASGSSDLDLFVTEEIKGKASGASSVTYQGLPKLKSISRSGASTIKEK